MILKNLIFKRNLKLLSGDNEKLKIQGRALNRSILVIACESLRMVLTSPDPTFLLHQKVEKKQTL